MNDLWERSLELTRERIKAQNFKTWFEPINFVSAKDNTLTLKVPNKFFKHWLTENYSSIITDVLFDLTSVNYNIKLLISNEKEKKEKISNKPRGHLRVKGNLNPKYTFKNFVVGSCNGIAHAHSMAISKSPGGKHNPLFIYGGVGLGKTHLLNAIGHEVLNKNSNLNVHYLNSEEFMNELIYSIRYDKMNNFRNKYRNSCGILLVDDIQFIGGKERTQDEFFHIFNYLYDSRRQIVVTSDNFPKNIPQLKDRLKSRFESGLIAYIKPPEMETKIAILKKKAEIDEIDLPNEVAIFLASRIKSNIRELEGCLLNLAALSSINNSPITLDLAQEILQNLLHYKKEKPSIEQIQKAVAKYFNIKLSDLTSNKKTKPIAFPRQISMYICRKLTDYSFPEIGNKFGGKDHSTVIHAVKKIESKIKEDPILENNISLLTKNLAP
ncbi:MAG: chromosomal replication initiator protein DnaA [Deltaproteobacteria bacterium]|nr:MAG: chromosomal replication initiator protein DnaA [Deltaproteobacteria bacterium]